MPIPPSSGAPRARWHQRILVAVAVVVGTIALTPGIASADPAKPTNYRSVVAGAHPALPAGVTVRVVGGDGFLELTSDGHEVVVVDAKQPTDSTARPYLRIRRDGTVQLNRSSVGYYYNGSRYGGTIPSRVLQPDLPADWVTVGHDGRYVWHDHRIHWMSPSKPPSVTGGAGRVDLGGPDGDWEVPLVVDGQATTLLGHLNLLEAPSPLPWYLLIGAVAAVIVVAGTRWPGRTVAASTLVATALATVVGWAAHDAVPPAAGGTPITWLLPLAAFVAAVTGAIAATTGRRRVAAVAGLGSACLLVGWVLMRYTVLSHAVLPTDLAAPVDRLGTALAAGVAIGAVVVLVRSGAVAAPRPQPARAPTASPTA